jgi:cell division protein FtsL
MIGIIIVIVVSIVVMYNQHKNYITDKRRIKELEERLEQYYKEREERLNKKMKEAEEEKGDINFMYKWIRKHSNK